MPNLCTLESEINDPGTFINSSSFSHGYDLISEGTFINSDDCSIHDCKDKETYKTRKVVKSVFNRKVMQNWKRRPYLFENLE